MSIPDVKGVSETKTPRVSPGFADHCRNDRFRCPVRGTSCGTAFAVRLSTDGNVPEASCH